MAHGRKLLLGGVALTKARDNRHTIQVATEVRDMLEEVMVASGFLENAPFGTISLIYQFGVENDDQPTYRRISKIYNELPVAIELDAHELQHATPKQLHKLLTIATLKTLVDVAKKYGLPGEKFVEMLKERQSNA